MNTKDLAEMLRSREIRQNLMRDIVTFLPRVVINVFFLKCLNISSTSTTETFRNKRNNSPF